MISYILTVSPQAAPVKHAMGINIFALAVFLFYIFLFALIVVGLIRLVRFLGSGSKEIKLIRMELGKLADEVQQLRQEFKGGSDKEGGDDSASSS